MLIGWLLISYHFLSKPLRYLDELITASEQLAQPGEDPIVLPSSMKNIQDELNLVREQALRNAMAAKEAEQRKNDLIVYLAHDLKPPLTSVIGYLTLLRDEAEIPRKLQEKYTNIWKLFSPNGNVISFVCVMAFPLTITVRSGRRSRSGK